MTPADAFTFVNWAGGGNPDSTSAVDSSWPSPVWGLNGTPTASQFQIDGTQPSSVPEPAIAGLAGVGIVLIALGKLTTALKHGRSAGLEP
jgi:hypothetical protein